MNIHKPPARHGIAWVKTSFQLYIKHPLTFTGLGLLGLMALMLVALVPWRGGALLSQALLPMVTFGLMAATRRITEGATLRTDIFRATFSAMRSQLPRLFVLGLFYVAFFAISVLVSTLVDGGQFMQLYLGQQPWTPDLVNNEPLLKAILLALGINTLLCLLSSQAPALIGWHGMTIGKSLFASVVAFGRNLGAFFLFIVFWLLATSCLSLVLQLLMGLMVGLLGQNPQVLTPYFSGLSLLAMSALFACFSASIYIAFADIFLSTPPTPTT